MRGWWRTTCIVASLSTFGSVAFAQTEPSVQPLATGTPQQSPPPAYAPPYYPPPPPPYGGYPRGPARLPYADGDPIPPGYHVVHRARQGLVIAGTVVFFVSYGIALSVAMIDDFDHQTGWLALPVAGPWLMMYHRTRPQCDGQSGNGCVEQGLETILRFYLALDGVAQAAGVTMLSFGLAGRQLLVRDDRYASVRMRLVPGPIGSSGYGATLAGRF
jgi:hypothetical protein